MAKQKKVLQRLLRLLNERPMTQHEILSRLKVNRRTVYENCKEASTKGWIAHDNELKIYHLTVAGRSLVSSQDLLYDSVSFEAHSQTLYPYYPSLKDKPKARCNLYIKDADRLKKMDDETYNVARFLSMGYYGLSENGTAIQAASGRLVDEILDIKARDILLQSKLDSQYADEVTVFNIENMPPGYDVLRRFQKLAAETKFLFVIEFDGKIWAKNQSFRNVEASRIKTINLYKESLREQRSLELTKKLDWIISILTKDTPTKRTYESLHMFSTKKDSIEFIYEWFRKYHVLKDNHKLTELVRKAFNSGLFKLEKETFYCLKIDLSNRKKFYDSLISKCKIPDNLQTNDFTYTAKGLENNSEVHGIDTKNITEVELNKLETFEQLFFNLFLKVRQKIDEAIVLYYSSTPPKEEDKLRYRKAIGLLNELLDIFYETMNVYTNYSPIQWSKAIQNKDKLEKLFSAVFIKIAKMRIRLSDAIASFRSHDLRPLVEQHISNNIYASQKLIKHVGILNDSDVGKDSEHLLDCLWKIYDACYEYAFPEPSLYHWEFKYNEGYKKFVELQKQRPDQTYDNFIKSYSKI